MTVARAKRLHEGDTLLQRPSMNPHDVSGFRRYEVTSVDSKGIAIVDELGYPGFIFFTDKAYLKSLEPVKVQHSI